MIAVRFVPIGVLCSLLVLPVAWASGNDNDEQILLSAGDIVVTRQDLQRELLILSEAERARTLATPEKLKDQLGQIYLGKRMIAEAERLGLDQTPLGQARLAAARRQALSETLRDYVQERIERPDFGALAREHYAVRRDEFQLPDLYKAAHILKKVRCDCEREEQRQRIEQLRARLQAGEDFATLAKVESDDTHNAAKGGDLGGWLKRDDLVAPFADAMVKLQPGQVSEVVETQFGLHLIKLLDHQPPRLQSFDEVQPGLEQRLRQTYNQEQLRKKSASYMAGPNAKFDDAALEPFLSPKPDSQ